MHGEITRDIYNIKEGAKKKTSKFITYYYNELNLKHLTFKHGN
jgi:hypothetical protein